MTFWLQSQRHLTGLPTFVEEVIPLVNVILMFKVSHELSENVISIFQVSQTHIHTHTLTYTYILTYPNPGWPQMAQMHSSILEHDGRETGTLQIWLCHDGRETGTLQIWLFHDGCR